MSKLEIKIKKLIEEATRFAKEMKKVPFHKKTDMLLKQASLDNVQYGSKPGYVPRQSDVNLGSHVKKYNEGKIKSLDDQNKFIDNLHKSVRKSGQEAREYNIPFKKNRTIGNNASPDFDKTNNPINIEHGGGKYYLEGLLSGNKNYSNNKDTQINKPGIWVHPNTSNTEEERTPFYASSAYNYGDIPAKLTGNIPSNDLKKVPNGYEAFLPQESLFKNRKLLKVENIDPKQAEKNGRFFAGI